MLLVLAYDESTPLRGEPLDEALEVGLVAVFFDLLDCNQELTDEVVPVSPEPLLHVARCVEVPPSDIWVLELLRLWMVRVLELVVGGLGRPAASVVVVASEAIEWHSFYFLEPTTFI